MDGLKDQITISRTDDAIFVIGLAKLLDILGTTRVVGKDTRTFVPIIHITKEKAREETKGKAKTKARNERSRKG